MSAPDLIGYGLLRPFQRGARDFVTGGGADAVKSAVGQILGTLGASATTQGEIPWRTELGSLLHLLRHQNNDAALQELARVYVTDALQRWEPRVRVTGVKVTRELQEGKDVLAIRVGYNIVLTKTLQAAPSPLGMADFVRLLA